MIAMEMKRGNYMTQFAKLFLGLAAAVAIPLASGCSCTAKVRMTNETRTALLVELSMPYPAYRAFAEHCGFAFELDPGATWNSETASRSESFAARPHGFVFYRLTRYDEGSPESLSYVSEIVSYGEITILGEWPQLEIETIDQEGRRVLTRPTSGDWIK